MIVSVVSSPVCFAVVPAPPRPMQPSARPGAQAERADGHTSRRRGGGRRSRELPAPCSTVHSHSSHLTPHYTILSNIKTLFPSEVAPLYSINYPVYRLFGHLVITNPHGRPISHAQLPQTAPATPHAPGTHVTSSWPLAELPLAYAGGSLFGAPTAVGRANSVKGYH